MPGSGGSVLVYVCLFAWLSSLVGISPWAFAKQNKAILAPSVRTCSFHMYIRQSNDIIMLALRVM